MSGSITSRLGPASGAIRKQPDLRRVDDPQPRQETMSIADAPATIADDYALHRDDIRLGVTLALAGVFFAVWFLGHLRQRVGAARSRARMARLCAPRLGTIGLAGILDPSTPRHPHRRDQRIVATAPGDGSNSSDHQLGVRWDSLAGIRRIRWGDEPRCPSL